MKHRLNAVARFIDNDIFEAAAGLGMLAGLVSLIGAGVSDRSIFDWIQLVSLAGFVLAVASIATTLNQRNRGDLYVIAFFALGIFVFNLLGFHNGRFPGLQMTWLWLALVGACALAWIDLVIDEFDEPEDQWVVRYMSVTKRFSRVFFGAALVSTIALLATFHSWGSVVNIIIVDAVLLILYIVFRGISPEHERSKAVTA